MLETRTLSISFRWVVVLAAAGIAVVSQAQVPDLLSAFDAGARSQGAGGALNGAVGDTFANLYNPAGLAYVDRTTVQIARRNFPSSRSSVTGSYQSPNVRTSPRAGGQKISHVGAAVPIKSFRKRADGVLGVSYSVTGVMDDVAFGPASGLPLGGGVSIRNFLEQRKVQTEFLTLGYGRTNQAGNLAWGFGLIVANQSVRFQQSGTLVDNTGTPISGGPAVISFPNESYRSTGVGLIAGLQYQSVQNPNLSYNLSFRSPIQMPGGSAAGNYSTIPGRIMAGVGLRYNGLREGKDDYFVVGANTQYLFGGNGSQSFQRRDQLGFGLGIEYNLDFNSARIPIRLGYSALDSDALGFGEVLGVSYGIGYTPAHGRFSLDLTYFRPRYGGQDTWITATYRF